MMMVMVSMNALSMVRFLSDACFDDDDVNDLFEHGWFPFFRVSGYKGSHDVSGNELLPVSVMQPPTR
jgi:hypothetical protein